MSKQAHKSTISLRLLLILSLLLPFVILAKPIHAAGLSIDSGSLDFAPGETKTFVVKWSSDQEIDGLEAHLSSDAGGFSISSTVYNKAGELGANGTVFAEVFDSPQTSGPLFEVTVIAPSGAASGSISISGKGGGAAGRVEGSGTYSLAVQGETTTSTEAPTETTEAPPTETTTTTAAPTETTTEAPAVTTATTAAPAETSTAAPTGAAKTEPKHFSIQGNGVADTFALMPANDVVPPIGFSMTTGTFQGINASLFTRAGSLPLVYGALSNDASGLFYLYNATDNALYNYFNDITLKLGTKTWVISPIGVLAPSPDFRYRSISINGQPMSAYESQLAGKKILLVYAVEQGQSDKALYVYNAASPDAALSKYDPKASSSPSPTPTTALISLATTKKVDDSKGGMDFLTILLIIIFVALIGGLSYVVYLNKAKIKSIFKNAPLEDNATYYDDDEDYDDHDDPNDGGAYSGPPIRRV